MSPLPQNDEQVLVLRVLVSTVVQTGSRFNDGTLKTGITIFVRFWMFYYRQQRSNDTPALSLLTVQSLSVCWIDAARYNYDNNNNHCLYAHDNTLCRINKHYRSPKATICKNQSAVLSRQTLRGQQSGG